MSESQGNVEQSTQKHSMPDPAVANAYWRRNVRLLLSLMAIWFLVSYGFGILLVEPLNKIPFFGFKFGFWWAQQGSIYVFIILIFYYCRRMNKLERSFGMDDKPNSPTGSE